MRDNKRCLIQVKKEIIASNIRWDYLRGEAWIVAEREGITSHGES